MGSLEESADPDMSLAEKETRWETKSFGACMHMRSEKRDGLKCIVAL